MLSDFVHLVYRGTDLVESRRLLLGAVRDLADNAVGLGYFHQDATQRLSAFVDQGHTCFNLLPLIVGGAKDTQVAIADLDLLMNTGTEPRDAWINPQGGHLGRELKGSTDPVIFRKVIMPWELRVNHGAAD